ncbi:MAG: SRPBCC family protein [Marmoricola sp.]
MTTMIEKTIEVEVPVHTAYNQWTQFESFPQFMEGVEAVEQIDDTHLHWKASIGGVSREWNAEIVQQVPDERVSWRATEGKTNMGTVSFHPKDHHAGADAATIVTLALEWEPDGVAEKIGDALNIVDKRAESDLERFKSLIESQGSESGGWRGEVHPGDAQQGAGTTS